MSKLNIAVSACLLGKDVRHNGGNTHNKWITRELEKFANITGFCPELAMGLGVPREPIRILENKNGKQILVNSNDGSDLSNLSDEAFKQILTEMGDMDGVIFQKKSPSCGTDGVKVYNEKGNIQKHEAGLFFKEFQRKYPFVPYIDSGRLNNTELRNEFIRKVTLFGEFKRSNSVSELQTAHQKYKYILMEFSPEVCKCLGKIAGNSVKKEFKQVKKDYIVSLNEVLSRPVTSKKQANVLFHILGYFKKSLLSVEKDQIISKINDFTSGKVPFIVPFELLMFMAKKYDQKYLLGQYYFQRHSLENI